MTHASQVFLFVAVALLLSARVRAQFGTTATVEPDMAATNREDPTASGTEIDLEDRVRALELLQGVLAEAPGSRPVLFGAPGSFTGLSLRGTDFQHTQVLLGELPLSNTDTGVFDFSLTPLSDFDRLEVYRGGAPAWLSSGAIGGVVRLIPRQESVSNVGAEFQAGSFGTYFGEVEGAAVTSKVNAYMNANVFTTDGDFEYVDDGGTVPVPEDDVVRRVRNAEQTQIRGFTHIRGKTDAGEIQAVLLANHREGGQPGPASKPTLLTHRRRSQFFGALAFNRDGSFRRGNAYRLQAMAGGGYLMDRLSDPEGELGLDLEKDTDDRFANVYGRLAAKLEHSPHVEWTLVGTAQYDHATPEDNANPFPQAPASSRIEGAVVLEQRILSRQRDIQLELRPSIRMGYSHAEIRGNETVPGAPDRNYFLPTIRVAGAVGPRPWLTLAASVFTGINLPTILQLFGDRAFIIGNPRLTPESSVGGDASVVMRGQIKWFRASLETRLFRLRIDDLIRGRVNSQNQVVFDNIENADIAGLEIGTRGQLTEHFVFTAAFTLLQTRNSLGNALPLRSPFTALSRAEGHTRELSEWVNDLVAYAEVRHTASGYSDAANLVPFPTRTTLEIGAQSTLIKRQLRVTFTVRNVTDVHTFDVRGFPLPGRSFAVSLAYRKEFGS